MDLLTDAEIERNEEEVFNIQVEMKRIYDEMQSLRDIPEVKQFIELYAKYERLLTQRRDLVKTYTSK